MGCATNKWRPTDAVRPAGERSRVIPQVPGERVWSVVCFFVAARARRQGLRGGLLEAACQYAAESGAALVEAYPSPNGRSYRYMGTRELYHAAGFEDVPVPDGSRPVMRRPAGPRPRYQ